MTPVLLTTPRSSSLTALVVKYISPPSAAMVPEFLTSASNTPLSTVKSTKEFPLRFIVYSLAPLRRTLPFTASMVPLFLTSLEAKIT